jgi:hypothetical protein
VIAVKLVLHSGREAGSMSKCTAKGLLPKHGETNRINTQSSIVSDI